MSVVRNQNASCHNHSSKDGIYLFFITKYNSIETFNVHHLKY